MYGKKLEVFRWEFFVDVERTSTLLGVSVLEPEKGLALCFEGWDWNVTGKYIRFLEAIEALFFIIFLGPF